MISIDEHQPPDPNSSSIYQNHHQEKQQISHEDFASVSDIDLLKNSDTNNPLPNFSIRDYVFGSRCKDITSNWPFSHKSLQLCLNYGVKNLLPPFESLDSLRNNCTRSPNHEETVICFDSKSTNDRFVSLTSSSMKTQNHLEDNLAHKKSNKSHFSQPNVRKCKSVMKLNSGIEQETMAPKVCPVCKTFSSSSNTTLNAHIDRCLSEIPNIKRTESSQKLTADKHRIKPRKTRLMTDIYKTAARCTIEDLDRRNGTSWANNSNFPDQEFEFQAQDETKEERKKDSLIREVDNHEPVYIDTNGTKVRILSMPKVGKLDDQKLQKGRKGTKLVLEKKKKKDNEQTNRPKNLKFSPNSKKAISDLEESRKKEDEGENRKKAGVDEEIDDVIKRSKNVSNINLKRKLFTALKNSKRGEETLSVLEVGNKKSVGDSCVGVVESSRSTEIPFQGSFTGLRNSIDDEFMIDHGIENNEDKIDDDIGKQGNYFQEMDPILIPGPPGSFLPPSPGASDELQNNSSVTRAQSSEDHHHTIKSGFPDSPVSPRKPVLESNTRPNESFCLALPQPEAFKPRADSSTTPVLRLMGKNLTVVKTDDDQFKPPPSSSPVNRQHQQLHGYQNQNGSISQHFNLNPPKEIIVIDDLSENDIRYQMQQSNSFADYRYGGGFSWVINHSNDGNFGRWVMNPRSFS